MDHHPLASHIPGILASLARILLSLRLNISLPLPFSVATVGEEGILHPFIRHLVFMLLENQK